MSFTMSLLFKSGPTGKKTGELSTDEWKSVIDQAVEMGMHQIHLSGGEPTVRHDLEDIVEHCTKKGLYTQISLHQEFC